MERRDRGRDERLRRHRQRACRAGPGLRPPLGRGDPGDGRGHGRRSGQRVGGGPIGEAVSIAISTPFGVGGARHHYPTERTEVDTVFMGLARRETYQRFPFDESMVRNQDDELSYRLLDAGGRSSATRPSSARTRAARRWRACGRSTTTMAAGRSGSSRPSATGRLRHLVPIGLVGALGSPGSRRSSATRRRLLALLLIAYLGAIVAATFRYGRAGPPGSWPPWRWPTRRCTCRTAWA